MNFTAVDAVDAHDAAHVKFPWRQGVFRLIK